MGEGTERLIEEIKVARIQAGDVLLVKIEDAEEDSETVAQAMQAFHNALDFVGLADKVAVVFHDGNVELQHVRFD